MRSQGVSKLVGLSVLDAATAVAVSFRWGGYTKTSSSCCARPAALGRPRVDELLVPGLPHCGRQHRRLQAKTIDRFEFRQQPHADQAAIPFQGTLTGTQCGGI